MRRILTGVDSAGRSCVVQSGEFAFRDRGSGIGVSKVFEALAGALPARPPGRGELFDLGTAPGAVRWVVAEWVPGFVYPMHHTDTVDLDIVLAGSAALTLDDGVHPLALGDCVVVTGVDHAWRAGPDGCTLSVISLGTPPPG